LAVEGYEFTLQTVPTTSVGFLVISTQDDIVESGTSKLISANRANVLFSKIDGSFFDLNQFDIGGSFTSVPGRWASQVEVKGFLSGGGSVSHIANISDDTPVYTEVVLPSTFDSLSSVLFSAISSNGSGENDFEFTLDNIYVSEVSKIPTPALLPGLIGMGAAALRKRKQEAEAEV